MKTFNKEEFNRLCAVFLLLKHAFAHEFDTFGCCQIVDGYETPFHNTGNEQIIEYNNSVFVHSINELKFDSEWNWIMIVIDKIKETLIDYQLYKEDSLASSIEHLTMFATKDTVVEAIWHFLNWYYMNIEQK